MSECRSEHFYSERQARKLRAGCPQMRFSGIMPLEGDNVTPSIPNGHRSGIDILSDV